MDINATSPQPGNIRKFIEQFAKTISAMSKAGQLQSSDIMYSVTPAGVARLKRGKRRVARVDGLNPVNMKLICA